MFTALPLIETSTPAERLQALKDAKQLMSGAEPGGFAQLFSASGATPGPGREAIDGFLRLAEYITTGHDYADTHPEGKRRPVIRNVTNVTVVKPDAPGSDEELEHFLQHVENGDFAEFIRNVRDADAAERKEDEDPKQDEDQRPSFE